MFTTSRWRKAASGFWGRLIATSLIVGMLGMVSTSVLASVLVDQTPLTSQVTLPPNIMLLIDDSGSMNWDYMPDANYLCDVASAIWTSSCPSSGYMSNKYLIDIERSSALNGVYYNPKQTYALPLRSNGTSYPTPSFPNGYVNPFSYYSSASASSDPNATNNPPPTVDIRTYNNYGAFGSGLETQVGPSSSAGLFNYFTQFSQTVTTTQTASTTSGPTCANSFNTNYQYQSSGQYAGLCTYKSGGRTNTESPTYTCPSGYTYQSGTTCTEQVTTTTTKNLFTYEVATGSPGAITGYNFYYVGTTDDCNFAVNSATTVATSGSGITGSNGFNNNSNGFSTSYGSTPPIPTSIVTSVGTSTPAASSCITDPAVQQNVANWFSYYRTRIMMAKSGIMTAFSGVDGSYRIGFASINNGTGGNTTDKNNLTNTVGSDGYSLVTESITTSGKRGGSTTTSWSMYLANVAPFNYTYTNANGSTALATVNGNTQKANLWTWTAGLSPTGSTPTVSALAAVGDYYASQNVSSSVGSNASPWATMTSDPDYASYQNISFACRASYTILTTDGFWNLSYAGTTVSKGASNAAVNMTSTATSAKYSLAANTPPFAEGYGTGSTGVTTSDSTSSPSEPTLADVAFYYWSHDLQSNISDEVPTNTADPAFWQHMTTFTMGLGFAPQTASPASAMANNAASVFTWAQAVSNGQTGSSSAIDNFSCGTAASSSGGIENIADLAHAGVNGHGGFYSVASPADFQAGLQDALARAAQRLGSGASLAANSTQLASGTNVFQATYYTGTWTGDLLEYSVDPNTGLIAQTPSWDASTLLPPNTATTSATPRTAATRVIYTHNVASGATSGYMSFANSSSGSPPALSSGQLLNLGSSSTAQANMVNYLRGDATNEQHNKVGSYRDRLTTVLGDIIDSQPVYEGPPNVNEFYGQSFLGTSGTNSYTNFANNHATRSTVVWVAANDGMLHAFDATTGLEVYAFMPGAVLADSTNPISNLANPLYGTSTTVPHTYFNDGLLTIADAFDGTSWHTVLVGTTGRGTAKAVYALDVTDPTNPIFMWERYAGDNTDSNSSYIGQITGQPVIAQTGSAVGEWSVLMGNGYNSTKGTAALLQFNLFSGALTVHTTTNSSTTNYTVTSNQATDTTSNNFTLSYSTTNTSGNGLAAPVVWEDSATNGISTKAWAGDLNGAVWQFVLNTIGTNETTNPAANNPTPDSGGTQVFQATDASGNLQPITAGMLAGEDPSTGNVWLFFGTGRYLTSVDWSNLATQSWYGVIVENNSGTPLTCATATPSNCGLRSDLVERDIIYEQPSSSTELAARVVTTSDTATPVNDTINKGSNYQGWYMDLAEPQPNTSGPDGGDLATQQGERMVTSNQFEGNLLIGTTRLPLASDPCNPSGSGWIMAISPFTGTNPSTEFFDINNDGSVNTSDTVTVNGKQVAAGGIGFSSLPNNPIFIGTEMMTSFNNGTRGNNTTSGATGAPTRVSWRELTNQ